MARASIREDDAAGGDKGEGVETGEGEIGIVKGGHNDREGGIEVVFHAGSFIFGRLISRSLLGRVRPGSGERQEDLAGEKVESAASGERRLLGSLSQARSKRGEKRGKARLASFPGGRRSPDFTGGILPWGRGERQEGKMKGGGEVKKKTI